MLGDSHSSVEETEASGVTAEGIVLLVSAKGILTQEVDSFAQAALLFTQEGFYQRVRIWFQPERLFPLCK